MVKPLVVDDDPHILEAESIGLELQWPEATVLRARTGEECLAVFRKQRPDVVLLDVSLPGMTGFEVLREIRRESSVPVIMITARDEDYAQTLGRALGASAYLVKPVSPRFLVQQVTVTLNGGAYGTSGP
ncbi:MAG: response regulator [Chloroflexi bacterium]|nr:response regulator [Chloroflexota bacterium]